MKTTQYKIVAVSGASGSGKTTILHMIENDLGIPLSYLPSYTTREPRGSDERGMRYVSEEQFREMERNDEFIWTKHVHTHRYGTRRADIRDSAHSPSLVATILTPDTLLLLEEAISSYGVVADDALFIHVEHPGEEVLRTRLKERGDSPEKIEIRIAECTGWDAYVRALPFRVEVVRNTGEREAILSQLRALFHRESPKRRS